MNHSPAIRWALCLLLLGSAGLATGCAHAPKPPQSSLISEQRLQYLSTPPPPGTYYASEAFHGYYGTCWRPWPYGWQPCVEPICGTAMPNAPLGVELMPPPQDLPPAVPSSVP